MKRVGVSAGQVVLDFGCNAGNYARSAAKVVGKTGKVYALDKDEEALEKVSRVVEERGLENIECLHVPEEGVMGDVPSHLVAQTVDTCFKWPLRGLRTGFHPPKSGCKRKHVPRAGSVLNVHLPRLIPIAR